jgi:uncharacterized metal-binding protein YceD (DUF177 family)
MKVHIRQISHDGTHLEGEENCPIPELELEQDGARCTGPLKYNLEVGISEEALWATGSLLQPVEMRCVNCLEKFVHEVRVPNFAAHVELTGPEVVDLTPMIREDLLLNLSAHPHCDRDGGKQCKGPRETAPVTETEEKREHDWEALNKLRLKG